MRLSDLLPPTDNLYKFFAITGLLILGWTSAGVVYLDFRSGEKMHALLESNAQFMAAVREVQANRPLSAEPDMGKISPDALKTVVSSIPILQAKQNEAMDDVSTANQWFTWFSKAAYYYEPAIDDTHPDFVVILPTLGVLLIEVKGWYQRVVS